MPVLNVSSYDLPLDCFEPGEKRPQKVKSKKTKPRTAQNGTKETNGSAPSQSSESRKRGPESSQQQPVPSKKPNVEGIGEMSTGVKRALEKEVRLHPD
jgi:hypothetical protein